jgi:uncharacterized protein YdaU (DUF1376 family)
MEIALHYYHHHIGDFIKATARLTDAQSMAYLRLIWMYYDRERPLPDDIEALAFQLGIDEKTVQLILVSYFRLEDGCWHHTRCDAEIKEYKQLIHKRSKAGKASAEHRANTSSTPVEQVSDTQPTDVQLTNNHEPVTNNHIKEKRPRSTRFDLNDVPDDWIDFCNQERPDLDPRKTFDSFRDYWIAQPGSKGVKADWTATWRNWIRNTRVSPNSQPAKQDRKMDLLLGRRQPDVVTVIDADYQERLNALSGPSF